MRIRTPHYYKDFKCIAGACTDTCCAGWEVDVDEASYQYYKKVSGAFGKRLKSVMVPSEDGGCTFTLNKGRCPFLNDANLCDLYTALGEDKLCRTCAEFPRFINEYGSIREIGIAPSCKTAGELIFNYEDKLTFDVEDDGKPVTAYNDIDANLYMQLVQAREGAYKIVQNTQFTMDERCILLLEYAQRIQRHMDHEQDTRIANVVSSFSAAQYCEKIILAYRGKNTGTDSGYDVIAKYFEAFPGMEVINPDWLKYCGCETRFMQYCADNGGTAEYRRQYAAFEQYYADREYEYEQLAMYYIYRYFLDAVYDYDVLLKVKNAVIGYIILKHLDVAAWHENGRSLTKTEQIDIAHLYSRQFEHSYTNFAQYSAFFGSKRCYSLKSLRKILGEKYVSRITREAQREE